MRKEKLFPPLVEQVCPIKPSNHLPIQQSSYKFLEHVPNIAQFQYRPKNKEINSFVQMT